MGTKLYYTFTEDLLSNESVFEQRMDDLCREIGNKGQQARLPEAVPPALAPALASTLTSVPAPVPAPTPTTEQATTALPSTTQLQTQVAPESRFTPSVQPMTQHGDVSPAKGSAGVASVGGLADLMILMREERREARADRADMEAKFGARLEAQEAEMKARLEAKEAEMKARLEAKDAELEAKIAQLTAPEPEAITDEDLVALQIRLESMHASKLITDEVRCGLDTPLHFDSPICIMPLSTADFSGLLATRYHVLSIVLLWLNAQEMCAMEDLIADYVELRTEMTGRVISEQTIHSSPGTSFAQAAKLHKLVALARAMTADPAFARQARRKFL